MSDSPYLGFAVLIIILGGFAAGLAALIRSARRREEERKQVRLEAGFAETPEAVEPLTERMRTLHHGWSDRHRVRAPWRKSDWGYELFLFDLRSGSGKNTKLERDQAVVISKDLVLPRFFLARKAPGDGLLSKLANKAVAWVASHFSTQVVFPEDPEFDAKYLMFGDDETTLRSFFDAGRRSRMAGLTELHVAGQGDGFLFAPAPHLSDRRADRAGTPEKLQGLVADARRLFEIFKP